MKQWKISVSTRLKTELLKLKLQRKTDDPEERLFASASMNLCKVWEAAREEAGITSVRFHDLQLAWLTLVWRCRSWQKFGAISRVSLAAVFRSVLAI
jgi:hypothetical protein